jgi:glycerol-1-phosphatase
VSGPVVSSPSPRVAAPPEPLSGAAARPAVGYDVALMDLDGVVYRGRQAVAHAAEAIAAARGDGMRMCYVTNNALRPPAEVAAHLSELGVPTAAEDVVSSAHAAARVLAERLPAGAAVLVVGGAGLREAVAQRGFVAVGDATGSPAAVVQGYDPEMTYARLAEATLAVRAGALWVASNADATVPTERGLLPGNGALVALVAAATGQRPAVAGKPEWALHAESVGRSGARRPLVVGDRLDTDIEAASRAGAPSLLVLTGVTIPADLLHAPGPHRPTFLSADLRGLLRPHPTVVRHAAAAGDAEATCGGWTCRVRDGVLSWERRPPAPRGGPAPAGGGPGDPAGPTGDDGLDALRAACAAAWAAADAGAPVRRIASGRPPGCEDLEPGT